jgi:predicted nucleic acid-binding Zn ribbon protein
MELGKEIAQDARVSSEKRRKWEKSKKRRREAKEAN